MTSGDAGGDDLVMPKEERAKLREDEQRAAAAMRRRHRPHVPRLPRRPGRADARAAPGPRAASSAPSRPDLVLTQSPERNYDRIYASHPDHLATGEARCARSTPTRATPTRSPRSLNDEGLEPHTVARVWIGGGTAGPTMVVDTTATIDKKIEALQVPQEPGRRRRAARAHAARVGRHAVAKNAGLPKGRLAEAFRVIATA